MTNLNHGAPFEPSHTKTPETDRSPYSDKRTIEARWVGKPSEGFNDRETNAVELSISHYKSSKVYNVSVTACTDSGNTISFDLMGGVTRISQERAARYNRKELERIATEALAAFPGNIPAGSPAEETWQRIVAFHTAADAPQADDSLGDLPDFFETAAAV